MLLREAAWHAGSSFSQLKTDVTPLTDDVTFLVLSPLPKPTALMRLALLLTLCVSASVFAGETVTVPDSIPHDGSRDVTDDLNAFFADLPDGSTVRFPEGAKYRIEGTVTLTEKKNIIVEGGGVVFRCTTPGESHAKSENYGGWRATRTRAHIRVRGGLNITLREITVIGAHPDPGKGGTYDANREAQHGFDLVGVAGCVVEKVTVRDVYGDCVYIAKSSGVVVRNSHLSRCGRQGIAVGTGRDILIEGNTIADSRRGIIDVEPYGAEWSASNVRIIGNTLGGSRLLLLPMGGSGVLRSVFIADNTNAEHNGTPALLNKGKPGQHRGPLVMVNNRWTVGGSPAPGLRVTHNDGVAIVGNTLKYSPKRNMTAVDLTGSTGVVAGNMFAAADRLSETESDVVFVGNATTPRETDPQTEWKRISGGFAIRTTLPEGEGEVVVLMRGGPELKKAPESIAGYGFATKAEFAWQHVREGQVIATGERKPEPVMEAE